MYTLSQLLQDAYLELGQGMQADATGGDTGFVTDTKLSGTNQEFADWTIFIVSTTDGLAPQGQYRRVSKYDNGKFTVETAFTAPVQSGDEYLIVSQLYPVKTMIRSVNLGLQKLGYITQVDSVSLITANDTLSYPMSVVWKRTRPLRIDMTDENGQWREISPAFWEYEPAAPGVAGRLIFKYEQDAGRYLRVWYEDLHPKLSNYNDLVSETVPENLARLATALQALVWQNGRQQGGEPYLMQRQNQAQSDLDAALATWTFYKPHRKPKLVVIK